MVHVGARWCTRPNTKAGIITLRLNVSDWGRSAKMLSDGEAPARFPLWTTKLGRAIMAREKNTTFPAPPASFIPFSDLIVPSYKQVQRAAGRQLEEWRGYLKAGLDNCALGHGLSGAVALGHRLSGSQLGVET